jgi:hypothetical protein
MPACQHVQEEEEKITRTARVAVVACGSGSRLLTLRCWEARNPPAAGPLDRREVAPLPTACHFCCHYFGLWGCCVSVFRVLPSWRSGLGAVASRWLDVRLCARPCSAPLPRRRRGYLTRQVK